MSATRVSYGVRRLGPPASRSAIRGTLSRALPLRLTFGLALYAHACFFLGLAGLLRAVPLFVLTIVFAAAFVRPVRPRWSWLLFVPLVVMASYPPLAFDETVYHLPFVQNFARDAAVRFLPDLRFPVFPVLHEMSCVPLFLLAGDVAPHFVAVVQVALVVALLVAWDSRAGWLAAAMFLGSPLVVQLATTLYVEMALALFVLAGFYALERERYALAGFFLGSACSVKYLGFYFAAAALVLVIVRRGRAAAFAAACAVTALPMTAWIVFHTGDPFFPFVRDSLWRLLPAAPPGNPATRVARLVWDVTFARDRVGMQPPVTPFLAVLVLLLIAAAVKRDALARIVVLIGVPYVAIFAFLPQDPRYLVPLLPLVSLVGARFVAGRWPKAIALLTVLAVAPGIAYAGYRIARQGIPPVDRQPWLEQRVPEYRALRRAGTERVYACGAETLKAYATGPLLGDYNGPWSYERVLADDSGTLSERLRRLDVGYYLMAKRRCRAPRANGGLELVYEDEAAQLWRVAAGD